MIEIRISVPGSSPRTQHLTAGEYIVGSSRGCHVRVRHPTVAPRHALLSICQSAADITIRQLEEAAPVRRKAGGTLTQATVHAGDVFQIGQCELEIVSGWTAQLPVGPRRGSSAVAASGMDVRPTARSVTLQTQEGALLARAISLESPPQAGLAPARRSAPADACVLFRCRRVVHTIGAAGPLDVVFLSAQLKVLSWQSALAPWRLRRTPRGTRYVLSAPNGQLATMSPACGTYLCLLSESERPHAPPATVPISRPANRPLFSLRLPLARRAVEGNPQTHRLP